VHDVLISCCKVDGILRFCMNEWSGYVCVEWITVLLICAAMMTIAGAGAGAGACVC
jgi:hypothetical protein